MNDSSNTTPPFNSGPNYDQHSWTPPTPNKGAPAGTKFFDSIRGSGYYRSEERWIGGVSGGLAQKYNLDPLIVRGGFVLLAFLSGIGLIAYAAAWALLPEQRDGRIHAEELIRGNFDGAHIAIAIALFVGLTSSSRFFWGTAWLWAPLKVIFWFALIAAIIYGVFQFRDPGKKPQPSGFPGATYATDGTGTLGPETTHTPGGPNTGSASYWQEGTLSQGSPGPYQYDPSGTSASRTSTTGPEPYIWTAPKPAAPTVKSPGATQFAILLGIFLLASAGVLLAQNAGRFTSAVTVWPLLAGFAVTLGGLAVIFNGFRGRSSGSGGFFGILGFLSVLATSALLVTGFVSPFNSHFVADLNLTPTSISQVSDGYSFGAGDFTLDLSSLDISEVDPADLPLEIPIRGSAGEIQIYVPESLAVTADRSVTVGTIEDNSDGTIQTQGGIGVGNSQYANAAGVLAETADIHLDIKLAVGTVRIMEREN